MTEKQIYIRRENGLHATDAVLFCQMANDFRSKINLTYSYKRANAKSLMSILSMDIEQDAIVTLSASGDDEADAIASLSEFLESVTS